MQYNTSKFFNQIGRSMLELLAVMAIICLFTISSIVVYNETNDKRKAQTDYEEILLAASAKLNQGTARTGKGIVNIQSDVKQTRRGNQIMTERNCPQNAVTLTVDKVSPAVCRELLRKNWDSPIKASSFYRAAEFGTICSGDPAQITREGYYIRSEEDCDKIRLNNDWNTFSVSFPMSVQMAQVRLCSSAADCRGCETCTSGNFCKSTCGTGQYCGTDDSCHQYEACSEGLYRDSLGNCHKCPEHAVCQDGITVAGCEEGHYLEGVECPKCPDPVEGCTIEDEQNEHGCITKKKIICSGETPLCQENESAEDFNTCYCPEHAVCTSSNGGDGSGGNGTSETQSSLFSCEDGYYKSGNSCAKCVNTNATKCQDEGTATACEAGYYLRAGRCLDCPQNATCDGDEDDFVCDEGWKQNGAQNECIPAIIHCTSNAQCTETNTYCNVDGGEGICQPINSTTKGAYLASDEDMTYQSAQNWCAAQAHPYMARWEMIDLEQCDWLAFNSFEILNKLFGISTAYAARPSGKNDLCPDGIAFLKGLTFWTEAGRVVSAIEEGTYALTFTTANAAKAVCEGAGARLGGSSPI